MLVLFGVFFLALTAPVWVAIGILYGLWCLIREIRSVWNGEYRPR